MPYKKFNFNEFKSSNYIPKPAPNKITKNLIWSVKFYAIGVVILFLIKMIISIICML